MAKYKNRSVCEFIVTNIDHIVNHIIPFFEKYNIKHLKQDGIGLKNILQLKNRGVTKNNHGND